LEKNNIKKIEKYERRKKEVEKKKSQNAGNPWLYIDFRELQVSQREKMVLWQFPELLHACTAGC